MISISRVPTILIILLTSDMISLVDSPYLISTIRTSSYPTTATMSRSTVLAFRWNSISIMCSILPTF